MIKKMFYKRLLLYCSTIILTGLSCTISGQSIQRQTISSYSSTISGIEGVSISQTAGQSFSTQIGQNSESNVFQGFQQPITLNEKSNLLEFENTFDLNVYPNPASSRVVITSNKELTNCKLELKDSFGRVLLIQKVEDLTNGFELDCSSLSNGIYFLTTIDSKKENYQTKKLIITK